MPQCGTLPSINAALFPKITGKLKNQILSPKPSVSRATKKTTSATGGAAKATPRKPALTKKGTGSFSVLGAPTTKVNLTTNDKLF